MANSFNVGTADWTLAPTGNSVSHTLTIRNNGDVPMDVTAVITNDGGGVFSLPSGGNVGNINGNSSATLNIKATVTAETNYSGILRIDADYSGGFSGSENVSLSAIGHHPVPHLTLLTSEINYGEVEQEYEFSQAVKIKNSGDATLTFNISLQDASDPDVSEFTLDLGSKSIGAGETKFFEMTF